MGKKFRLLILLLLAAAAVADDFRESLRRYIADRANLSVSAVAPAPETGGALQTAAAALVAGEEDKFLALAAELLRSGQLSAALAANDDRAQLTVGGLYWLLGTDRKSAISAEEMWEKAAAAGNDNAKFMLGVYFSQRTYGEADDKNQAIIWWERAAAAGNGYGQNALADVYYRGDGVPADKGRARELWQRAAAAGNGAAQRALANFGH